MELISLFYIMNYNIKPGLCLQCVIVVFHDHHSLFFWSLVDKEYKCTTADTESVRERRCCYFCFLFKVSKDAKIRNRYNQVPQPTQDTNGTVTNSQLDTTNESQEVSPFPAGDHKVHINRRAQRHSKHKTEQNHKRSTKEVPP